MDCFLVLVLGLGVLKPIFDVCIYHPGYFMAMVIISASVKRFSVSRVPDFDEYNSNDPKINLKAENGLINNPVQRMDNPNIGCDKIFL